jgi:hypothetical protein
MEAVNDITLEQGALVRFANEHDGGPVHRITSVMNDGMVELHDMGGYFAPHLFVVADDVGDIPPARTKVTDDAPAYTIRVERKDHTGKKLSFEFDGYGVLRELMDDIEAEAEKRGWFREIGL